MLTFLSQSDQIFIGIILIFAFIGVIRGFLKELTSIFNWVVTCYLTSIIKPFALKYLNIEIPFFADLIVNFVLFVILIIIVSLLSNLFVSFFKEHMEGEINSILGLVFGGLKGYLIVLLILSFRNMIYKDKTDNEFIKNCKVCRLTKVHQNETQRLLEILLGDFINKTNIEDDNKTNKQEETKQELNENKTTTQQEMIDKISDLYINVKSE